VPKLTPSEIIKRAERIREYHKLVPTGAERLHINRGRQLMYELLKDVFGDPPTDQDKRYSGDWEMLYTQRGAESLMKSLEIQQKLSQNQTTDEQQRKLELALVRLATYTTNQVKAMILDTAAENLVAKALGTLAPDALLRKLENDLSSGPTPPENQAAFSWQEIWSQQGLDGLRAWVKYELELADYKLKTALPGKVDKSSFETQVLQNKVAYLKQIQQHLG
jgi:hypothetical protein